MVETWFCMGCRHERSIPFWEEKSQFLTCYGKCGFAENHTNRRREQTCPACRHVHWREGSAAWGVCPKCGHTLPK